MGDNGGWGVMGDGGKSVFILGGLLKGKVVQRKNVKERSNGYGKGEKKKLCEREREIERERERERESTKTLAGQQNGTAAPLRKKQRSPRGGSKNASHV